ncbi:MAG: ATP-binding protein [Bacteroidaceae bacterium]|nr:ATP-binding protein [Bacteroidaceae bacterium]
MPKRFIIGRKQEIATLKECHKSAKSEFVVVYGRRRIGKTFIVNESLSKNFVFHATGIFGQPRSEQIKNFHTAIKKWFDADMLARCGATRCPTDWMETFNMLERLLTATPKPKRAKKVVFLDELPWMDSQRSGFITALEHFWNSYAAWTHDIILVVCGSAASWIVDKVINNRGGLHNRLTRLIHLQPFTLAETEEFIRGKGLRWNRYDIVQCYMSMGGIPYYLDNIPLEADSYPKAIDQMFFSQSGILRVEYNRLYKSLFTNSTAYEAIVEQLARKKMGMTLAELSEGTKILLGGHLKEYLDNLEQCGFLRKYYAYGNKKKGTIYQLTDLYTLFYLQFVKEYTATDGAYWQTMIDSPSRRAWAGYAFEILCLTHIEQIRMALGFSSVNCTVSSWRTGATEEHDGAQIDLVIDRRDQIINLCEMKFSNAKYAIDAKYEEELRNKISAFGIETRTNSALHLTMVTTYGVKQNSHSGIIASQITLDDLFT